MKHSIFALPALLRPTFYLALASQSTFSVHDDLLAFPQFEVNFSDEYLLESQAQERLNKNAQVDDDASANLAQYQPAESRLMSDGEKTEEIKLEYQSMILDNQRYLCSIPQVTKPSPHQPSATNETLSKLEEEKELARATDRGWELLSGMQGDCVYFISGWWSYKFCYNDGVRQFHQLPPSRGVPVFPPMEDPAIEGFTLGRYRGVESGAASDKQEARNEVGGSDVDAYEKGDAKTTTALGELVQRGESRYLVQRLEGGTKCDLTGRDRKIEVQFHCNPSTMDRISLIKETSTCAYLMVIQTPRLCHDVAFLPPQKDQPNKIICSPILTEDEVEIYNENLQALKKAEQDAKVAEAIMEGANIFDPDATPPPPTAQNQIKVVGDITLGARRLIPEGLSIEKSNIVGGGKITYIDTVADSDGRTLSKEELEKLGLGDLKAVEKLKSELQKMAKGEKWKLDVIETPRGREYRGIIGSDENDESDKEGEKKGGGDEGKKEKDGDKQEGSQEEYYHEEL